MVGTWIFVTDNSDYLHLHPSGKVKLTTYFISLGPFYMQTNTKMHKKTELKLEHCLGRFCNCRFFAGGGGINVSQRSRGGNCVGFVYVCTSAVPLCSVKLKIPKLRDWLVEDVRNLNVAHLNF